MSDRPTVGAIAIVIAGGPPPTSGVLRRLPETDLVIAADSGLDHGRALGLKPTMVIGDLDSVSADGLHWAQEIGAEIVEHSIDKDATDLDLALQAAAELTDDIVVVDSGLGRLDHVLANLALLASPRFASTRVTAYVGAATVSVVRTHRVVAGRPGEEFTLLAVSGPVEGLTVEGVRWPLNDHYLEPGSTLGVSNVFEATEATITVKSGVVLVVQPWPEEGRPEAPVDGGSAASTGS
ncbi:MAG: thiamine diphosphokinase [Acidimicrobiales bacterium]